MSGLFLTVLVVVSAIIADTTTNQHSGSRIRQKSTNPFDDDAGLSSAAVPPTGPYSLEPSTFAGANPLANIRGEGSIVVGRARGSAYAMSHFIPTTAATETRYTGVNSSSNPDSSGRSGPRRDDRQRSGFRNAVQRIDRQISMGGVESSSVVAYVNTDENAIIRFLVSQRVYGYPGTNGTFFSNYRNFVWNNHPLLSICMAHRQHPFGTKKRIIVFSCLLAFTITVSFVFLKTDYVPEITKCREGCSKESVISDSGQTQWQCVGGYNNGISYASWESNCKYYQSWMLSAACGAATVPYFSLLHFLATCGCVQGRDFFKLNCAGRRCRAVVEYFGGGVLSFILSLSIIMVALTVIQTAITNSNFAVFETVLISKVWSFGDWFLWTLPYFAYRYNIDRRHFHARINRNQEEVGQNNASSTQPQRQQEQQDPEAEEAGTRRNTPVSSDRTNTAVESGSSVCVIS